MKRILITCALGKKAEEMTIVLRDNPSHEEVYLVGVDMENNYRRIYYDKTFVVPPIKKSTYICNLWEICYREKINLIIPWSILELEYLWAARDFFNDIGTKILIDRPVATLMYKDALYCYLEAKRLPVLDFKVVSMYSSLMLDMLNDYRSNHKDKKWLLKPSLNEGGRGIVELDDSDISKETLKGILNDNNCPCVMQEKVDDPELYRFDGLVEEGKCISFLVRKEIEKEDVCEVIKCRKFERECKKILKDLNYSGIINIQAIKRDNKYYIIDANTRAYGPVKASYDAGGNILWWAVEKCLYGKIERITKHRVGAIYRPLSHQGE